MSPKTFPNKAAVPRILQGTTPGLLDPTQPARILRHPDSVLSFAVFDSLVATGRQPPPNSPSAQSELPHPRRIVVETNPASRLLSGWRFVEEAELGPGVQDEGTWPRLAIICG